MGALIVSSLIAIAAASALWWWYRGRDQQARINRLSAQVAACIVKQKRTEGERDAARRAFEAAEAENTALRERNTMLTDLLGKEASWPTP